MSEEKLMLDAVDRIMTAVHELGFNEVIHAIEEVGNLLQIIEKETIEVEFKGQFDAINEIANLPLGLGENFLREANVRQGICSTEILPHSRWDNNSYVMSYISHDPSLIESQEYHTFYATGGKVVMAQIKIINDILKGFFVMTIPAILSVVYTGVSVEALIEVIKNQRIKKRSSWFKKIFD